jgi:hypothetical protein
MNTLQSFPVRVAHLSLKKRIRLSESAVATFAIQGSNVTNAPHFTMPNNNISTPGAGAFTGSSGVADFYPEKQGLGKSI